MPIPQIILIVVVGLLLIAYLYLRMLPKGAAGEFVAALVMKFLGKKYNVIHDLTFDDGEKTVQVDHVIISEYGIFVVETKNYTGTIYGSENADKFYKYAGKKKYEFYSPIKQNRGHIYSLKKVIGEYKHISVIVFSGLAKLKVDSDTFVGHIGQINKYIKSFKQPVMSEEEVAQVTLKLKSIALKGRKVKKQHVEDIKLRMQDFDNKLDQGICPKCGGKLLNRKGQYGEFLGCSNYPKCKFKKTL